MPLPMSLMRYCAEWHFHHRQHGEVCGHLSAQMEDDPVSLSNGDNRGLNGYVLALKFIDITS